MSPPFVRRAEPDDAGAIARIRIAGWRAGYRELVDAAVLADLDEAADTARFLGRLRDPELPTHYWVSVDHGGEVRGFVVLGPDRDESDPAVGEIWALYVDPESWRSGHGRALMASALDAARAVGANAARLWVLEQNLRGRAFYGTCGFTPDGASQPLETLASLEGTPVTEVRLRRSLTDDA